MPNDFEDYIVEEPYRTKRGALKYQPADTDWSIDRLGELQEFYQSTYKRPLPVTVKGQGTIHNKWGYDHRAGVDISLNPATEEGKAFIAELQRRRVPFIAFDRAIPGSSTGPHVHLGRPSSRTAAKYGIGQQVKRMAQKVARPTDDFDSYVTGDPDLDRYVVDDRPAPKRSAQQPKPAGPAPTRRQGGIFSHPAVTSAVEAARPTPPDTGMGALRRTLAAQERIEADTGMGRLRQLDKPAMAQRRAIEAEVRRERGFKNAIMMPQTINPVTAISDFLAGRTEEDIVGAEVNRRLQASTEHRERMAEIAQQLTDEDRANLTAAVNRMRGQGNISRGIETGSQRVGSGLLYKLAAIADIMVQPATTLPGQGRSQLGDYLRRQAGRGELAVEQIEAELPPELAQQAADFATHAVGALPEIFGATAAAGPVGGFAALGGLEAAGRKQTFAEVAKETAKGAVLGAVFKGATAAELGGPARTFTERAADTARSGAAIGLGTFATEKAFGADDYQAARSAASNVLLHAGMRVPGEIARFTAVAERALKEPDAIEPTPTVPADLQAKLARAEEGRPTDTTPIEAELKAPTAPPAAEASIPFMITRSMEAQLRARGYSEADINRLAPAQAHEILATPPVEVTKPPTTPAEPAAEGAAITPAAPSRSVDAAYVRERIPPEMQGARFTDEGIKTQLDLPAEYPLDLLERGNLIRRTPEGFWELSTDVYAEPRIARPALADLLRERMETGPERPAEPTDLGTVEAPRPTEARRSPADRFVEEQQGVRDLLTLEERLRQQHGDRADEIARQSQETTARIRAEGEPVRRLMEEVRNEHPDWTARRVFDEAMRRLERGDADIQELGDVDVGPTGKPPRSEGGYIDLNEIREGLRAGKLKIEEAVERLRERFPNAPEDRVKAMARRERDPLIGIVDEQSATAMANPYRAFTHSIVFRESLKQNPNANHWRYETVKDVGGVVYWNDVPTAAERANVETYLSRRNLPVDAQVGFDRFDSRKLWEDEIAALDRPHHATQQPRTDTGQFAPGEPGGMEAARSQLRTEARRYATDYKRLDLHQARREGLDIINDDVARNYFGQLRRMVDEFLPAQSAAVDRAETLYNQGKYGQATMLAESIFRSLPDKVNEYAGADAAIQLAQMGKPSKADWTKVLQEVRERLKRTGGLSGGGSTFYDVNKYPEGGRPDHAKIAYILEPVVEALKADASRLIAEGKLKAADYVAHIRKATNDMLQREEFADWHPLNKSAALGVLVDRLRQEGPPAGPPPSAPTEPAQPAQRARSLPKTLERSGRDPGTNLTYDRLPNEAVNRRVEARLEAEGVDALEAWYRSAPESADRTAAHRVLVDHYTAEAVRLADTAPQRAQDLLAHARELSNLEDARATTLGQAVQMYSNLLRYTPAGVMREITRLARQGAEISNEQVRRLTEAAHEAQRTDREVRRLERKLVEAEATEAPEPVEVATAAPRTAAGRRSARQSGRTTTQPEAREGAPRRYRPRPGAPDTPAERIRRQLDEAAQRRRAQRNFIAAQLRAIEQQRTLGGYWKRSMNITRGLMVSALSTAMRNLQSQALRFDIERLDDLVEHTWRRSFGLDSDLTYRNIWRNANRKFKTGSLREFARGEGGQVGEAKEILAAHEAEYHRMFNVYAGGVEVPIPHPTRARTERVFQTVERAVEIANYFNRVQEFHIRSAEFLAELDLHLRKEHNQTLEQYVRRNGIDAIPLELVRRSVDKALEVTFADVPAKDGAGGRLIGSMIEIGNYIPPTVSPVAFPRFMYNNIKFLYQHSPAGMLDLARRGQNRPRVIARSLVGTSMLLLAYQFRSSDHAGEKWYELKFGDTTLDARPFGPFSTYLFIAEAIRRAKDGVKQFTLDEIGQVLGASVLGTGAGTELLTKIFNQITAGEWEKLQRTIKTEAGEWGRALLTPVRQVKDLIAAFDASQAVTRDTTEAPFTGPIRESIPFASTDLPEARRATTATPIRQERPAVKAITGWRVETPKTFLQRQLDELNFSGTEILPSTGNPQLDALQKRLMGPLMDQLSTDLENDAEYRSLSKKARAAHLRELIADIREEVREAAAAEQPELYEQYEEERKPRRQREYEQELNSPGLSRALELGVPMPIPPRRPGEDDIAYRARLLQTGRARRARLDTVVGQLGPLDRGRQRSLLHQTLYGG